MDEEENFNVNAWLGKPPGHPDSVPASEVDEADDGPRTAVSLSSQSSSPSASSHESDLIEIPHRPARLYANASEHGDTGVDDFEEIQDDTDELRQDNGLVTADTVEEVDDFVVNRQDNLVISVPELTEDERDEFDYLPDHFTAKRILYALPHRQYIVKLGSGEVDLVSLL